MKPLILFLFLFACGDQSINVKSPAGKSVSSDLNSVFLDRVYLPPDKKTVWGEGTILNIGLTDGNTQEAPTFWRYRNDSLFIEGRNGLDTILIFWIQ